MKNIILSIIKKLKNIIFLFIAISILFQLSPQLMSPNILQVDDFVEYWAAGKLNLIGGNPYSPEELLPLQFQVGRHHGIPVMMWNPPWTLAVIMPFAYLDYPFARFLWFLGHTAILVFCANYLWRYYGGANDKAWVAILITLTFLPSLFALKTGQISALLLLGLVCFLSWIERRTWGLLSLAILLMSIKPHILYLLIFAFFWWSLRNGQWNFFLISGIGIILGTEIALIINPHVLSQYSYAISTYPPYQFATPTIGGILRFYIGLEYVWLQFLPPILGLMWFFLYWRRKGLTWNWPQQLPLLIIFSVLTASYGWTCDYVVLLLPIILVAQAILRQGLKWTSLFLIILYLSINLQMVLQVQQGNSNDFWFLWVIPALSGWYLLAIHLGLVTVSSPGSDCQNSGRNLSSLVSPSRSAG
jgi:hypothetical protein